MRSGQRSRHEWCQMLGSLTVGRPSVLLRVFFYSSFESERLLKFLDFGWLLLKINMQHIRQHCLPSYNG